MSPYHRIIQGLKRIFQKSDLHSTITSQSALDLPQVTVAAKHHKPAVIPRNQHTISRKKISPNAVKVLYRLHNDDYQSFLVGGGVRDLLLGKSPKDFDIATNAHPEEVDKLFRNCRLIGRRFRLAHVHFGREIIEVATFRAQHGDTAAAQPQPTGKISGAGVVRDGMIIRDNVYGTLEDDAWRRDFTINALYYNIANFTVVDYTGGMQDLKAKRIRLIGDPLQRYQEDPVRMLRALRFAAKLDFTLDKDTESPIYDMGHLLSNIPPSRLYEECLKLFLGGQGKKSFDLLIKYQLLPHLFANVEKHLQKSEGLALIHAALDSTDQRITQNKPVTPAFIFSALLWEPLQTQMQILETEGMNKQDALFEASHQIGGRHHQQVNIPKRIALNMREIWHMQLRLERNRQGKRAIKLLGHPRFRAAYDFLVLRAKVNPELQDLADFWTQFQEENPQEVARFTEPKKRRPYQKRRRPQKKTDESSK
ncbi:polynucleotide adenylyltransferase PcnB [Candidatus Venteria ishoeyi]|uniref:Poly(A) polymerase I n=1 Tax=Candidatus Venteria ishoeyi TaxID=1899563 RepID=A0A1H6FJN6_9GAMM|nr:polynucleotide adenylyltransferase PcnB [Candidatus Venteria ishoeyi]MDM8546776.1 polynucleotide adenylyltransferase PcnB [Candidatus Venteria ishoeyi]SEH09147.1 Poly(A) polymerase I precursor [Candidatus Venteria ishoeyi]SEH09276.1 Poly(A) polymerase I precursor [Candidatus Venteria ishoeyi]